MPEEAKTDQVQAQPVEPQKYSVEELEKKLSSGEIDVSSVSPEDLKNMIRTEEEPPAQPAPAQPASVEQPGAAPAPEQPQEPFFKSVGEFLRYANDETGLIDRNDSAAAFIKKVKDKLTTSDSAVQKWQEDAVANKAKFDQASREIAALKEQMEKLRQEDARRAAAAPKPVQAEPDFESEEPDVPQPSELADQSEWNEYHRRVHDRDNRIQAKKIKHLEESFTKRLTETQAEAQKRLDAERQQIKDAEEARRREEAAQRALEETSLAADDFILRHREFEYGDGLGTKAKNDQYSSFINTLDYMANADPRLAGRTGAQLVQEYLAGNPATVQAITERGVRVPNGLKQFAILAELSQIAIKHNLTKGDTNRLDFDAAYVIKKNRDGADLDELNRARASGAAEVLDVMQARQSAPPEIRASEARPAPQQAATPEQLMAEVEQINAKLATASPQDRDQMMLDLEAKMRSLGMEVKDKPQ